MIDGTVRLSFERHARRSFAIKRQKRCHQKAKVSPLDLTMSKAPKRPRQRDDHRQQGDTAGARPPKSSTRKPRAASKRLADTALDSVSTEIPTEAMEGPEVNPVSSPTSEQGEIAARYGTLVAEGNQNGPDQQGPHNRVWEEVEEPMQAVAPADSLAPTEPNQGAASNLSRPSEGAEVRASLKQESTQHRPTVHSLQSKNHEDGNGSSRIAPDGTVQGAIQEGSPRLQAASDQVRNVSRRVKVWTQESSAQGSNEPANPIYILAAITLGIPALLSIPLIGLNPGVQEGTFTTVLGLLLLFAFVTAVVFEIKRLVDQPSDADHH